MGSVARRSFCLMIFLVGCGGTCCVEWYREVLARLARVGSFVVVVVDGDGDGDPRRGRLFLETSAFARLFGYAVVLGTPPSFDAYL